MKDEEKARTTPTKKTRDVAKETRGAKVLGHLAKPRLFQLRHWMIYVCGGIVLAAFIFSAVQQFRVWRYNRILRASKIRINELSSRVESARLEGMQEVAKSQHKLNAKEVKEINTQIRSQESKRVKLKKSIGRMQPTDLLRAFKEEGF